jgi:hypothetical protein
MNHGSCWPHDDVSCCPFPPEFVRLRYFFGQRLGVVDFADEQSYHAGKQRFHNLRAHGSGVSCGLRAERFVWPQGTTGPSTVLLVRRGAAHDACGRELVVGADQCIDVAAWYARNRERLVEWSGPVFVGLRYRECPSDPAAAPRDPCGCDTGGCEYARVREGFELTLLTEDEVGEVTDALFPAATELRAALAGEDAVRALNLSVAGDCPAQPVDPWLILATFTVTIDAAGETPVLSAIGDPDNSPAERRSLLSTRALQEMIIALAEGSAGQIPVAPRLTGVDFDPAVPSILLPIERVSVGPGAFVELAPGSFQEGFVRIHRAADDLTVSPLWEEITPGSVALDPAASGIRLTWAAGALAPGRYRIAVESPPATPIVDQRLNALTPATFVRQFQLTDDGTGALTFGPVTF